MTTAPIVLFVYNRPIYTQRTVESLKQNEIAGESQLYIYSDGPKNESDQQQVEQVREYVKTITGFKKVWIIEHEKNWGLSRSIISGISEIINQFGRVIVMEDDLLSSPYFLRFMNEALNYYEKEENVISISGYFFPINDCNIPETFFLRWADCWGWATWKRGWDLFEADGKKILDIIQSENLEAAFNMDDSYPYTQMLRDQINHKNDSWGIRWYASSFIKKRLTLCTNMSLIHNFGCNQSGSHFLNETTALDSKLRQIPVKISPIPIVEDHYSKQQVFQFYERTYKHDNHKSFFKKKFVALNHLSLSNKSKMINKIFNLPHHILHYIYIKLKKQILPPLYGWSGNYPSWEAALHDSKGYDSPDIFTKLKTASLKVKSGEAVYERDSVLFDKIEYSWPLLAGLMWIASQKENTLNIIDYGGALGTTYFQNRLFLKALNELHWSIIEQKHLVEFGNKYFENESLRFFDDLDSCLAQMHAETILFSGVLQYLQNPYAILKQLLKEKITYILFDRTLFHETDKPDQLMIQKVSPAIYDASFPCWFFNLSKFLSFFSKDYDLIADFPGFQEGKGFIFKKKNS